jgi:hypothetical protein
MGHRPHAFPISTWRNHEHKDNDPEADTRHLERLGSSGAYPEEVALYLQFKSEDSDVIWNELIRRADLSDRRTARVDTAINRRRTN